MDWISVESTSSVSASFDSVRQREPKMVSTIGADPVRQLLNFQTAELNRSHAYLWGFAQLAIGAALLVVVLFVTNGNKAALILSASMLMLVIGMQFAHTDVEPDAMEGKLFAVFLHPDPRESAQIGQRMFDGGALDMSFVKGFIVAVGHGAGHILDGAHPTTNEIRVAERSGIAHGGADTTAAAMAHHNEMFNAE